jgi:demethylmenaquinone methyltransferase / 2-methoxy-6-polyprenyl-1,4-benzoquinol methylase
VSHPPLPLLPEYWADSADRQRAVTTIFDRAAGHYDWVCAAMSLGLGQRYRRDALWRAGLRAGMATLDVATGTGLLAREIARTVRASGRVIGIDPSAGMMAAGRRAGGGPKPVEGGPVPLVRGVGERLPFPDARFDFVAMGYALRHVRDLDDAFAEYQRVLRPGGRLLVLEITAPVSSLGRRLARIYFGSIVPAVARVGSADAARMMRFYWDTIDLCVPPETVLDSLRRVGFADAERTVVHGIFSEYTARKA